MVELGYGVLPGERRRGYAGAALAALLDRTAREPAVRRVRLAIAPDNDVSRRLAVRAGFVEVGEQMDEVDGRELLYERDPPVG